jgi:catechol 2,3-dioxygenase-like lactoylglutathione lyase family enzyme
MTAPTTPAAIRMHHHASVTTDQEATRKFYEDIVGLPLVATWTEIADGQEYCHTFFGLGDGAALAFFQFADLDYSAEWAPPAPPSPYRHIALLVDSDSQAAIRDRATGAGVDTLTLDHGYCRSLYVNDPDGLILEFTIDHPEIDKISALQRENAHDDLSRWLSGDHSTNNDWRW